ncbi:Oidioi.mRNA.OKI2018_I69.PAR.g12298.t1.cds [Oikopleura dioica]|uniref:Thioredoxin domain-containing protein 17 n=1 Tax=Oikopleura dioica TaxID=34765 RepID=A0ABN7S739_OIKDI|nr:Oidioi.mRNA.OKI2018_I69.PAR.g12298.t1.cds [Oikopleura dioica]
MPNHVTGYAEWQEFVKSNSGKDIFALFCGGKDENGKSWCPDCVTAEPVRFACRIIFKTTKPPTTNTCNEDCGLYGSCITDAVGNSYCSCDDGYEDIAGTCEDIDECLTSPCPATKPVCVNTLGSYTCNTMGGGSSYFNVYADPHFKVSAPGQPTLCFNFQGKDGDIFTLLKDNLHDFTVNAKFGGNQKHSWIEEVGLTTHSGTTVKLSPKNITLGKNGSRQLTLIYNNVDEWEFGDVLIQRHHDSHGKHVALIHLRDGPTMRVHVHKDQLGFEASESEQLNNPEGIVGTLMANNAYEINEEEETIRSKFWLAGTSQKITTTMPIMKNKGCYTLSKDNVKFLLPVEDLRQDSLFDVKEVSPKMIVTAVEK